MNEEQNTKGAPSIRQGVRCGAFSTALATYALPQTDSIARLWARVFTSLLFVQVIQAVLIAVGASLLQNTDWLGGPVSGLTSGLVLVTLFYLLFTLPFAAGQLLMSPRSARLVRRYGTKAVGATGMFVMAAAIGGYASLGTASPIWLLGVLFGIQGAAIGVSMPAATAAVMDVLPRERAGAGSALTNTARQVAVALSVAILGSILAEFYRSSLSPTLAGLPAAARSAASSSITATQAVAQQLGTSGRSLLGPANDAFVHSMRITTLIAAVLALAGGFVVLRWMPGKPRPATEPAAEPVLAGDASYEAELAILEEQHRLESSDREG